MLVSQIDLNYPSMLVFEYKAGIWKKPVSEFDYIAYTWKTWWYFILIAWQFGMKTTKVKF